MTKRHTRKRQRAASIRPRKDLIDRLERELRSSKVREGAIGTAFVALKLIIKAKEMTAMTTSKIHDRAFQLGIEIAERLEADDQNKSRPYLLLLSNPREKMRLQVRVGYTPVDLYSKALRDKIWWWVLEAIKEFPDCGEGAIDMDGVEHYCTYKVVGLEVEVALAPRDMMEEILNRGGMSTYDDQSST
jgi:hypothetical protein